MTKLEFEILTWYSRRLPERGLENIESKLTVSHREITEVGFFTFFHSERIDSISHVSGCIPGPFITSAQAQRGSMSLLSISNSEIQFLEVMALEDDEDANQIGDFELGEQF